MTSFSTPPGHDDTAPPPAPLKFPSLALRGSAPPPAPATPASSNESGTETSQPDVGQDALDTIDQISRRIDRLASDLGCLGYFDDDDDKPRAA